jgi:hypothetical protein
MIINAVNCDYKAYTKKKCALCPATEALTVHHKIPKSIIKRYDIKEINTCNLETLCRPCHDDYTKVETDLKRTLHDSCVPEFIARAKLIISTLSTNTTTMKDTTKEAYLRDLSFFFRRTVTMDTLPKNDWDIDRNYAQVIPQTVMTKFWVNHYKSWKQAQLMQREILEFFKE